MENRVTNANGGNQGPNEENPQPALPSDESGKVEEVAGEEEGTSMGPGGGCLPDQWYARSLCGAPCWWWPTYGTIAWKVTVIIMVLLIWGAIWSSVGPYAAPGGGLFNFGVILMVAHYFSVVATYCALPPLVGMLLVGVFFKNTHLISVEGAVEPEILNQCRYLALTVVLIRAGLGLDPVALKKLSTVVPRLAFMPCLVEGITVALSTHLILGFPFPWGLLAGSVMGAVSPAVTVHYLLALKEKNYGQRKGIPTLIIAASSIDDIIAITIFGVMSAIIFSSGSVIHKALIGLAEVLIGVALGSVLGVIALYLPLDHVDHVAFYRGIILASGSYFVVLGSHRMEMIGAGFMAAIVSAFIAAYGWKKRNWKNGGKPVQHAFTTIWLAMQIPLFTLIGYQLDLSRLHWHDAMLQIGVLAIGLVGTVLLKVRMLITFCVVIGAGFNLKERLFISIAWIPKATVQAALGPTALNLVEKFNRVDQDRLYAESILTLAVLGILITAPLGAIGILFTGPRLLSREEEQAEETTMKVTLPQRPPMKRVGFLGKCCRWGRKKEEEEEEDVDRVTAYKLHRDSVLLRSEGASLERYV